MCAIVYFIIDILKTVPKRKREKIYQILFLENEIDPDLEINGIKLEKIKSSMDSFKQINICISEKNYDILEMKQRNEINLYVIKLFFLSFRIFFRNILYLNIDLNIYEINNYFNKECNPYKIKENRVLKFSKVIENVFLSNMIIIKHLSIFKDVSNIKFILYDSYQVELNQLMNKYFTKNSETQNNININNTNNTKEEEKIIPALKNKLFYFDHLIQKPIKNYLDFYIEINALDPLLFFKVNLLLNQYKSVVKTTITFFNFEKINLRKTLLNAYYFYLNTDDKEKKIINPLNLKIIPDRISYMCKDGYKIYYNCINNIKEYKNKLLVKDEEIPNELFPYFNYNLNLLFFILMEKFQSDKNQQNSLTFNFQSINDNIINLHSYNNYNCAIMTFIFNLFDQLETNPNLENICLLEIILDDLSEKKEYIIQYIFNKLRNNKPFNFHNINLTCLTLDIPNITLILPFEYFPFKNLKQLILKNLSINDLENISNTLIKNKSPFKKLSVLEISIGFMLEDFKKHVQILLTERICDKLEKFTLKIPCYVSHMDIVDMLTWIKKSRKKEDFLYHLKLANEDLSICLGGESFVSSVGIMGTKIKKALYKRNLITDIKCENDYKSMNIIIKMLNKEEINYFLNFIYCFNKMYEKRNNQTIKDEKRQKIFENIFYYMGKFGKIKKIKIEII